MTFSDVFLPVPFLASPFDLHRSESLGIVLDHESYIKSYFGKYLDTGPILVSHYSATGNTISCDAPYSAIAFGGELFLQYPPCEVCLGTSRSHF